VTLVLFAASREVEAAGSGDHRYAEAAEAADAIKRIAGTGRRCCAAAAVGREPDQRRSTVGVT